MSEPLTIIFGPTLESRRAALLSGCAIGFGGALLAGAISALGVLLLATTSGPRSLATGLLCCAAPCWLLFLAAGARKAFVSGRDAQVVLDAERLTHREHALPVERLVRIATRQTPWRGQVVRWFVVIQDDAGGAIELQVTQDGVVGTFDVRAILTALLPRLPALCTVEPRVRAYASGGRLE